METLIRKIEAELSSFEVDHAAVISARVQTQYTEKGQQAPLRMLAFDPT